MLREAKRAVAASLGLRRPSADAREAAFASAAARETVGAAALTLRKRSQTLSGTSVQPRPYVDGFGEMQRQPSTTLCTDASDQVASMFSSRIHSWTCRLHQHPWRSALPPWLAPRPATRFDVELA